MNHYVLALFSLFSLSSVALSAEVMLKKGLSAELKAASYKNSDDYFYRITGDGVAGTRFGSYCQIMISQALFGKLENEGKAVPPASGNSDYRITKRLNLLLMKDVKKPYTSIAVMEFAESQRGYDLDETVTIQCGLGPSKIFRDITLNNIEFNLGRQVLIQKRQ